jgi:opacity protein-like surface antigen
MTMGRTVALAAAMVLVSAGSGSAQDDFARNGFFVGLAGSYAIDTFEDDAEDDVNDELAALGYMGYVVGLDVDASLGINGRVGYRFHPHFSAELLVEWLDGFDADLSITDVSLTPPVSIDFATIEIEPWVITGNVKGHLLTGRYQPYLLAGAGVMTAKVKLKDSLGLGASESDRLTDFAARFGGGIDVYLTENIVLTAGADYVLPTGDVKDLDYVSIDWGFQYRF